MNLMESFLMSDKVQELFARFGKHNWLRYFLVTQQVEEEERGGETNAKVDIHIEKIPEELRSELRRLAAKNIDRDDGEEDDSKNSCHSSIKESTEQEELSKESIQNAEQLKMQINALLQAFLDQVSQNKDSKK